LPTASDPPVMLDAATVNSMYAPLAPPPPPPFPPADSPVAPPPPPPAPHMRTTTLRVPLAGVYVPDVVFAKTCRSIHVYCAFVPTAPIAVLPLVALSVTLPCGTASVPLTVVVLPLWLMVTALLRVPRLSVLPAPPESSVVSADVNRLSFVQLRHAPIVPVSSSADDELA